MPILKKIQMFLIKFEEKSPNFNELAQKCYGEKTDGVPNDPLDRIRLTLKLILVGPFETTKKRPMFQTIDVISNACNSERFINPSWPRCWNVLEQEAKALWLLILIDGTYKQICLVPKDVWCYPSNELLRSTIDFLCISFHMFPYSNFESFQK